MDKIGVIPCGDQARYTVNRVDVSDCNLNILCDSLKLQLLVTVNRVPNGSLREFKRGAKVNTSKLSQCINLYKTKTAASTKN